MKIACFARSCLAIFRPTSFTSRTLLSRFATSIRRRRRTCSIIPRKHIATINDITKTIMSNSWQLVYSGPRNCSARRHCGGRLPRRHELQRRRRQSVFHIHLARAGRQVDGWPPGRRVRPLVPAFRQLLCQVHDPFVTFVAALADSPLSQRSLTAHPGSRR